jgi:uncharacterized damage-inducible protein DinB
MSTIEGRRLSEFSAAVRESTLKRLRSVPEGYENWRMSLESMSFADVAQHLIDADNWLFKMLELKNLRPMVGEPGLVEVTNRDRYLSLLEGLMKTGARRAGMLENMTESQLSEMIFDGRFGREVSVWWIVVRGNLDHEIHHRGQIVAYLRAMNQER